MAEHGRRADRGRTEPGEEDDRELEALGGVNGEHAHGVLVIVQAGALGVENGVAGAALQPLEEGSQALGAARLELARLLDEESGATVGVAVAAVQQADLDQAAVCHEALHQHGQREVGALQMPRSKAAQAVGDEAFEASRGQARGS